MKEGQLLAAIKTMVWALDTQFHTGFLPPFGHHAQGFHVQSIEYHQHPTNGPYDYPKEYLVDIAHSSYWLDGKGRRGPPFPTGLALSSARVVNCCSAQGVQLSLRP